MVGVTDLPVAQVHVYETTDLWLIVGSVHAHRSNPEQQQYRILRIDRTGDARRLTASEDEQLYTADQLRLELGRIRSEQTGPGKLALTKRLQAEALLGFVQFYRGLHMLLATAHRQVGVLNGYPVFTVTATTTMPVFKRAASITRAQEVDEKRYFSMLDHVDLTKDFFYCRGAYDLTSTLQRNMTPPKQRTPLPQDEAGPGGTCSMFTWNEYFLEPWLVLPSQHVNHLRWVVLLIHGYFSQSVVTSYGRELQLTLISRRSRFYAGTRYLKRGISNAGHVANEVETEQIVAELDSSERKVRHVSSLVQVRGSIPLFWAHAPNPLGLPKPPIVLTAPDPYYTATRRHFERLARRYGEPTVVLNLVKAAEKHRRESVLRDEYTRSIRYMNHFLPPGRHIDYVNWDFHSAWKRKTRSVPKVMTAISERVLQRTGLFSFSTMLAPHTSASASATDAKRRAETNGGDGGGGGGGGGGEARWTRQRGVLRTNCIDSMDRTNTSQFCFGKAALGHQLALLGVVHRASDVRYDSPIANMLLDMYEAMGDTVALQYGGSTAVNTMAKYRQQAWIAKTQDLLSNVRRFYSNNFTDTDKQHAINLFLGLYRPLDEPEPIWAMATDQMLHMSRDQGLLRDLDRQFWLRQPIVPPSSPPVPLAAPWDTYYPQDSYVSFAELASYATARVQMRVHAPSLMRGEPADDVALLSSKSGSVSVPQLGEAFNPIELEFDDDDMPRAPANAERLRRGFGTLRAWLTGKTEAVDPQKRNGSGGDGSNGARRRRRRGDDGGAGDEDSAATRAGRSNRKQRPRLTWLQDPAGLLQDDTPVLGLGDDAAAALQQAQIPGVKLRVSSDDRRVYQQHLDLDYLAFDKPVSATDMSVYHAAVHAWRDIVPQEEPELFEPPLSPATTVDSLAGGMHTASGTMQGDAVAIMARNAALAVEELHEGMPDLTSATSLFYEHEAKQTLAQEAAAAQRRETRSSNRTLRQYITPSLLRHTSVAHMPSAPMLRQYARTAHASTRVPTTDAGWMSLHMEEQELGVHLTARGGGMNRPGWASARSLAGTEPLSARSTCTEGLSASAGVARPASVRSSPSAVTTATNTTANTAGAPPAADLLGLERLIVNADAWGEEDDDDDDDDADDNHDKRHDADGASSVASRRSHRGSANARS